jgi:cytochrome c oxidase subunit 3/cytochrome o ubiquinol oxidase subunit 3
MATTTTDEVLDESPGETPADHGLSTATNTGVSNEKLAMWSFLGSECLLFGALISTYFLYRGRNFSGPTPKQVYDIPYTSISSFVLALAAIQRGDQRRLRLWLTATALLGTIFIGGQVYEFTSFIHEGLTVRTNLFGSSLFVLTGFHGVHVTLGIMMLLSLVLMSARGRLPQSKAGVVEIIGLYWHFVDVVWIVIFTVVYLIPSPVAHATRPLQIR